MPADPLQALQGALQDRYRVERPLGRGGMALVYLAHDLKHDRQVAIKVLRPELTAMLGRERFLREIQIAAKLNHPHVLSLHDSGEANGLLYFVMPFIEGESLLQRLERERQLPIDEAVRIVREVASALSYAHGRGVLHRDIKPANILLSDGHAVVADFGLARALTRAKTEAAITASGLTIGTPTYMSPEQAAGQEDLDERSDIYSLGCVLYELIAGDPPYAASNPQAVLAKHAAAPVPSLRTVRRTVPEGIDEALKRALAKAPADRFRSAAEFAAALGPEGDTGPRRAPQVRTGQRWAVAAAVMVAVAAVVWGLATRGNRRLGEHALTPDTTVYAVLPFDYAADVRERLDEAQLFHEALASWVGVRLVDRVLLQEALRRQRSPRLTNATAARLAREIGAGRYMRGEISLAGDSLRLRATVYDVSNEREPLAEALIKLPRSLSGIDSLAQAMTDRLLLRQPMVSVLRTSGGTRSLPALQSWLGAQRSLGSWDFVEADRQYASALAHDSTFAKAALWLAVVRVWSGIQASQWVPFIERATARRHALEEWEQRLLDALRFTEQRQPDRACPVWRELARERSADFVSWFGLASCLRSDNAVVHDGRSPSGWRFRASSHEAVQAFRRAFELMPATHTAVRGRSYDQVRSLLFAGSQQVRLGRTVTDGRMMLAGPGWSGDSLEFIPFPMEAAVRGEARTQSATRREALRQQRRLFSQIATSWVAASPESSHALEALALALDLLGDPSALDTLRRARRQASTPVDSYRLAATEVWFLLKQALSNGSAGIESVQALGDSLLRSVDGERAEYAEGIATLLGRATLAAQLSARVGIEGGGPMVRSLVHDAPALLVFAAMGGPTDSIRHLEPLVEAAIEATTLESERVRTRQEWLERAARIAYPDVAFLGLQRLGRLGDPLLEAQASMAQGRPEVARAYLASLPTQRKFAGPEEIVPESLYPEARLQLMLDEPALAAASLDASLGAIRRMDPQILSKLTNAAALVRMMALRAEIADRAGDRATAARWARHVATLWSTADQFLHPTLRRMAALAAAGDSLNRRS